MPTQYCLTNGGGGGGVGGSGGGRTSAGGEGGGRQNGQRPAVDGCSMGLKTVFNRRRYNSFSISVLEYIPVCFCWFSFFVQFHVPSRVCIDSLVLISVLENASSLFVGSIF